MELNNNITLLQGNCLELMKNIPSESVDCVITDPPYLINYKTNYRKAMGGAKHNFCNEILNDSRANKDVISEAFIEMYRVLKNNSASYVFCSYKTIEIFKSIAENVGFKIKNQIIWVKNNWTAGDLQAQFGQQYEVILLLNKGRKKINGKRISDVWNFNRISGKCQLHQNQKPIDLLEQCINKHTNENDLILDCFMGSGSTGVACKNLNRNFIGIELNKEYFEIAKKRMEE